MQTKSVSGASAIENYQTSQPNTFSIIYTGSKKDLSQNCFFNDVGNRFDRDAEEAE